MTASVVDRVARAEQLANQASDDILAELHPDDHRQDWEAYRNGGTYDGPVVCVCGWAPRPHVAKRNQRRAVSLHVSAAHKRNERESADKLTQATETWMAVYTRELEKS